LLYNQKREEGIVLPTVSKSKIKANAKYSLKAYDGIELKVKKGKKESLNENTKNLS
jgi:hypothetical protein